MTAQEKAKELVDKYSMITKWKMGVEQEYVIKRAKECAIIAVDEILKSNPTYQSSNPFLGTRTYDDMLYWQAVKQEIINKL